MMKKSMISGLIAAGIALVCFLPPIIHFVSGPLGPVIGGFVGGLRLRGSKNPKSSLVIGATLGVSLMILLLVVGAVFVSINASMPTMLSEYTGEKAITLGDVFQISLILLVYGGLLGTLGGWIGIRTGNK